MNKKITTLLLTIFFIGLKASHQIQQTSNDLKNQMQFYQYIFGCRIFHESVYQQNQNIDPERYAIIFFPEEVHNTNNPRIRWLTNKLRGLFLIC